MNYELNIMKNPWMDFASYSTKDASRFKGREEEIKKFLDIIDAGTMSVLYANSGIGKTSFLNAGITPIYQQKGYFPIRIVFPDEVFTHNDLEPWLLQCITDACIKQEERIKEKRQFAWELTINNDIEACKESLWWHLHTKVMKDRQTGETFFPLLIFDQFEEIFTKSKKYANGEIIERFFKLMGQLASTSLPSKIEEELDRQDDEGNYVEVDSEHHYKVIFSLRKEYLSDFDYWTNDVNSISELHQNRMFLLPLKREQATRVITEQPTEDEGQPYHTILNKVTQNILDLIDPKKKDEVEPFMLSALCSKLFNEATSKGKAQLEASDVDANINNIVLEIYEEKVQQVFSNHEHLKRFEDALVDKDGHRNRPKIKELEDILFKETYLQRLEDAHLVRTDTYDDDVYIELIHDLLAKAINKKREEEQEHRLAALEKTKKRQKYVFGSIMFLAIAGLLFAVYKYLTKESTIITDKYVDVLLVFNPDETLIDAGWEADVSISLFDTAQVTLLNKALSSKQIHIKGPGADTIMLRMPMDSDKETTFDMEITAKKEWLCDSKSIEVSLKKPTGKSIRTVTWSTMLTRSKSAMYQFGGKVTNSGGTPIAEAFVVLGDKLVRTDADGYFTITINDSTELMGSMLNVFKSEYVPKEERGVDILNKMRKYKEVNIALNIRPSYDSLYYRQLMVTEKIINKEQLTSKDSNLVSMYLGNNSTLLHTDVSSPDTTFYFVFKQYPKKGNRKKEKKVIKKEEKDEEEDMEGRIFGYYTTGKSDRTPFDGYTQEIERDKTTRRWKMSIQAYDSVFNKKRITGIFKNNIINLSK